jgi:hypothetical protein
MRFTRGSLCVDALHPRIVALRRCASPADRRSASVRFTGGSSLCVGAPTPAFHVPLMEARPASACHAAICAFSPWMAFPKVHVAWSGLLCWCVMLALYMICLHERGAIAVGLPRTQSEAPARSGVRESVLKDEAGA